MIFQTTLNGFMSIFFFLFLTGLIVTYNVNRPVGDRVVSVEVRCTECRVPDYEPLELDKTYRIVSTPFVATGGDGYTAIADNLKNYQTGETLSYIQRFNTEVMVETTIFIFIVYSNLFTVSFYDHSNVLSGSA